MKYKEVKRHYDSGGISRHYFVDENGNIHGEVRTYHENGQLEWHYLRRSRVIFIFGEVKMFNTGGTLIHHCLKDVNSDVIADVIYCGNPSTHSEGQLIQIAKEHNLPLLSELPKTEAELTHWNLKYPDCPCLPIESE